MTDNDARRIEDKVDGVALVLAELKGSLSPTLDKLTGQQQEQDSRLNDHEKRVRALERFRWSIPSVAVLSLLVSLGLLLFYLTQGGR